MDEKHLNEAILVLFNAPTAPTKKHIITEMKKYKIDLFLDIELVLNITKHKLVPKHTPLTKQEKKELLEK